MKAAPDTPASGGALVKLPSLRAFEAEFGRQFPYLARVIDKRLQAFDAPWADEFDRDLNALFRGRLERLARATKGYALFFLDAVRSPFLGMKGIGTSRKRQPRAIALAISFGARNELLPSRTSD
jgi:hypothetical protein